MAPRSALRASLVAHTLASTIAVCACGEKAGSLGDVRSAVADVRGSFVVDANSGQYSFDQRVTLDRLVRAPSDTAALIDSLVACLDDPRPSASVFRSRPVATGVMCHEALRMLIYYEPSDSTGDVAPRWPGTVGPDATTDQLLSAKREWGRVVRSKTYSFL
jgi:hypothetical protein